MTALEWLNAVAGGLGADELTVFCLVAAHLGIGRERYGALDVARTGGISAWRRSKRRPTGWSTRGGR